MTQTSNFRHDPTKSVLYGEATRRVHWRKEPAVCGYRALRYHNELRGAYIRVPVHATPAIIGTAGVIVASDDGFVRFFDTELERLYWEQRIYAPVYSSIIVDAENRRTIVATTKGRLFAIDFKGNLAWNTQLDGPVFATPGICPRENLLVVACFDHQVVGIALSDGAKRYSTELPRPWHTRFKSLSAQRNPYASPAVTLNGLAVVCTGDAVLLIESTGQILWTQYLSNEIKASPIISPKGDCMAIATNAGSLHVLGMDGCERQRHDIGEKITGSGVLTRYGFVIGSVGGSVWCVSSIDSSILWKSDFGAPVDHTSLTLTPVGDVVATTRSGNAICLASDNGAFLWESSQILGLDEHDTRMTTTPVLGGDGKMYCASYYGDLYQFTFDTETQ